MSQCEKDQSKWYASTKMCSDMIMPRCKLMSLRSIANERIMPQYKTISKMTKLCCMLSQVSVSWSNHLKHLPTMMRRLCSYKHVQSKHPVISHTPMWKESNHLQGIAMPQKPSSIEKSMPLCKVHQMKYANHVSCSNVKNDVWSSLKGGHALKIHHRLREVCPGIMAI